MKHKLSDYMNESILSKTGLTMKEIEEITQEIDMGLVCFVHKETKEILSIPEEFSFGDIDSDYEEVFRDQLPKEGEPYWEFRKMSSRDSFIVMEQFTNQLSHGYLKDKLSEALNRRKPFRNFKNIIDNAGEYREKWFEFSYQKLLAHVIEELEMQWREG